MRRRRPRDGRSFGLITAMIEFPAIMQQPFLAAVGLKAGGRFFETVWTRTGLL